MQIAMGHTALHAVKHLKQVVRVVSQLQITFFFKVHGKLWISLNLFHLCAIRSVLFALGYFDRALQLQGRQYFKDCCKLNLFANPFNICKLQNAKRLFSKFESLEVSNLLFSTKRNELQNFCSFHSLFLPCSKFHLGKD